MAAHYLIRFDDICPTMNWEVWRALESSLDLLGVKPILAVVPDNLDPALKCASAVPDFWRRVRRWQAKGWTIGMHGYQHLYVTSSPGILPFNWRSEFAGLSYEEQKRKLVAAVDIFNRQGIRPQVWVAPAHSFDRITVGILHELGIPAISDGLAAYPYRCNSGALWVPQQLWRLRWMPDGVWTVCCHHNGWNQSELSRFTAGLNAYRAQIDTFSDVSRKYSNRKRTPRDWAIGAGLLCMIRGTALIPRPARSNT